MRINQFLAYNLGISRREGDEYIKQGFVKVDNKTANLGQVITDDQVVRFRQKDNWITINNTQDKQVILFYKPIFSLTSRESQGNKKTIYNILPKKFHHLKPAGRLDYMSEGLLVLSNDGQLIQELTHPKNSTSKVYLVAVQKMLSKEFIKKAQKAMKVDGYKLNSVQVSELNSTDFARFRFLNLQKDFQWYRFTLSEGRNNQIRKMVSQDNQKVQRLIRVEQGGYKVSKELKQKQFLIVRL